MRFQLFVNAAITGVMFGMWQQNVYAGCFAALVMGDVLSITDYLRMQRNEIAQGRES